MANIFGANYQSPQEQQESLLKRLQQQGKNLTNTRQQFGMQLANALSQSFGGGKKRAMEAETREEMLAMAQDEKNKALKEAPDDPLSAEIAGRVFAVSKLRELGGAENIQLANQISDSLTALTAQHQQYNEQKKLNSANLRLTEQNIEKNEQAIFQSKPLSTIVNEADELRAQITDRLEEGTPSYIKATERLEKLDLRREELISEGYIPANGIAPAELGITQEELDALTTDYGLPKDTLNTLINMRRVELEDERLEFQRTKLPANMQIKQDDALTQAYQGTAQMREYADIAKIVRADDARTPGKQGEALRRISAMTGAENPEQYIQARITRAVTNAALADRPPGSMSDSEWDKLFAGQIDKNASNEDIAKVMYHLAILEGLGARHQAERAQWLNDNRDFRGFDQYWNANRDAIEKEVVEQVNALTQINVTKSEEGGNNPSGGRVINVRPVDNPYNANPSTSSGAPAMLSGFGSNLHD